MYKQVCALFVLVLLLCSAVSLPPAEKYYDMKILQPGPSKIASGEER
jgi:hypothetical protein